MMDSYWLLGKGKATEAISMMSLRSIEKADIQEIVTYNADNMIEEIEPEMNLKPNYNRNSIQVLSDQPRLVSSARSTVKSERNQEQDSIGIATRIPSRHSRLDNSNRSAVNSASSKTRSVRESPSDYLHLNGSEKSLMGGKLKRLKRKRPFDNEENQTSSVCILL